MIGLSNTKPNILLASMKIMPLKSIVVTTQKSDFDPKNSNDGTKELLGRLAKMKGDE